ncbi:Vps53-like protein [Syncephalis plumigaleata]|nr:Vps53-like protein [Syncephalis plumigaleata]
MAHLLASDDPLSTVEFDLREHLIFFFQTWRVSLRGFQSINDNTDDTALDLVHKHIQEMIEQVEAIYTALEMTKDVKRLDTAKKNLNETILYSIREKRHAETAQLLKAVAQLFEQVEKFSEIDQLKQIRQQQTKFQKKLSDQLFREFTSCFHAQGVLVQTKSAVQDICLVAQALDTAFHDRLIEWYTRAQLHEYRSIFCGNEEVASLEGVPRRYTWLKRLLKTIDDEHNDLFPESWHMSRCVAQEFCKVTCQDMQSVLEREAASDVAAMLRALQQTLDFEQQLDRKFTNQDKLREALVGESSATNDDPSSVEFIGSISKAFEPFLGHYIESIDRSLSDLMQGYLAESSDLVYFLREAFGQCTKLSTGRPLVDLSKVVAKWLAIYANTVLKSRIPRNERRVSGDARIIASYIILNTADYCQNTAEQVSEEKFREKVDTKYKEDISMTDQREPLLNIIVAAVKAMVREVEIACEPSFQRLASTLRKHLMNHRYYRSFCDQFAETFIQLLDMWTSRIKRLSSMGAVQVSLIIA